VTQDMANDELLMYAVINMFSFNFFFILGTILISEESEAVK
jgi:hypothetical protein